MGTRTVSSLGIRDGQSSCSHCPRAFSCLIVILMQCLSAGCTESQEEFSAPDVFEGQLNNKLIIVYWSLKQLLRLQEVCVHHLHLEGRLISYFLME